MMRLSHESVTTCLGPGKRYVIWVQGCRKKCRNCINPEGRNLEGGYIKNIDEIKKDILLSKDIVGITISGGEPFLQYKELKNLIMWLKTDTVLDCMLYSGYTYEEIMKMHPDAGELFDLTDIFIDGEYQDELNTGSMFRGSDNQKIYFFTEKYKKYADKIKNTKQRDFSFEINNNGDVFFIGVPPENFYANFLKELEEL